MYNNIMTRYNTARYIGKNNSSIKPNTDVYITIKTERVPEENRTVDIIFSHEDPDRQNCIDIRLFDPNEWDIDESTFTQELINAPQTKLIHVCPHCGSTFFSTTAAVSQDWIVDCEGNFQEVECDCSQVIHDPDNDNIWSCIECGEEGILVAVPENTSINMCYHPKGNDNEN